MVLQRRTCITDEAKTVEVTGKCNCSSWLVFRLPRFFSDFQEFERQQAEQEAAVLPILKNCYVKCRYGVDAPILI